MKKHLLSLVLMLASSLAISQSQVITPSQRTMASKGKRTLNYSPKSTPIWGVGAAQGVADGEFANAFVQSGTAGSYSPTSWTALSVNDNGGAVTPGAAYWVRNLTGYSAGAYWGGTTPVASLSQPNGVALFDSDFMDNGGTPGAFGTGTSPSSHRGELISPRIDLTGYTDSALAVSFFGFYREFLINELSVSISTDDGSTWSPAVDYRTILPNTIQASIDVTFPTVTQGVTNLTACRLKFTFDGDYYFAILDDITISTATPYDFAIGIANSGGTTLGDAFNTFQVSNDRHKPLNSLVSSTDYWFGANVKNFGFSDFYPASGTLELNVDIQMDMGGTWTTVHSQSIAIDTVLAGGNGTAVTDELTDTTWAQVGDFRAVYYTTSSLDLSNNNDTSVVLFSLNDNEVASKVNLDTSGYPVYNRAIFPGGTTFDAFEYGSMFSFANAGTDSLRLDSISYGYYVPNGYVAPASGDNPVVQIRIYEFDPSSSPTIDQSGSNLTLLYVAVDTLFNISSMNGTYGISSVSEFIDFNTFQVETHPFENNTNYVVTIYIDAIGVTGGSPFSSTDSPWFAANDAVNYALNAAQVNAQPSPVNVVTTGAADWNWVGFGADVVPSIALHFDETCTPGVVDFTSTNNLLNVDFTDASSTNNTISSWSWDFGDGNTSTQQNPIHTYAAAGTYTVCLTVTDDCGTDSTCQSVTVNTNVSVEEQMLNSLELYPNPANNIITINGITGGTNVQVSIVNSIGKVVIDNTNINESTKSIDLSHLADGIYFVNVRANEHQITKRISVVK